MSVKALVGATIGFFVGGPTGARIGWTIGSFLDAPEGQDTQGPRLDSLTAEALDYGAPIPIVYGRARLAGFRMWQRAIREQTHTEEVGGKGGGGGATNTTYSYYGTFAVGLCEGPIVGIRKIWADSILIYDASDTADANTLVASNDSSDLFVVYKGTSTQEADSLIQATQGIANTPAYRNIAYIVFDDMPLEKHGNRIPNITCEVVTEGTDDLGLSTVSQTNIRNAARGVLVNQNFAYVYGANGCQCYNISDATSVNYIRSFTNHPVNDCAISGENLYVSDAYDDYIYLYNASENLPGLVTGVSISWTFSTVYIAATDNLVAAIDSSASATLKIYNSSLVHLVTVTGITGVPIKAVFENGILYILLYTSSEIISYDVADGSAIVELDRISLDYSPDDMVIRDGYAYIVTRHGETFQVVDISDPASMSVVSTVALGGIEPGGISLIGDYAVLSRDTTNTIYIIDISDPASASKIAAVAYTDWGNLEHAATYENLAVFTDTGLNELRIMQLRDTITADTVALSDIVGGICERAGLTSSDIDVTDLTDEVDGYIITRNMSARAAIEPLQKAYFFDGAEYGNKINFVKRGGSSAKTILQDDLGATEYGSDKYALKQTRMQNSELPSDVTVGYMSSIRDYEVATQRAQRINYSVPNTVGQELAIVMSDDKALQIADITLYNSYTEREKFEFALTNDHVDLNPTDVVTVTYEGDSRVVRLVKLSYGDVIECEAISEDSQVYTSTATAAPDTWSGQTISLPGNTYVAYRDIPMLRNADNDSGLYFAAAGYKASWTGAQIFKSVDGGTTYSPITAIFASGTAGSAVDALPDAVSTLWDRTNTLTIALVTGSLSSATEDNVIKGTNYLLVGSEIIQFANATLNGDGTYTVDTLIRGRRGTEWATTEHEVGEGVILLTESTIRRFEATLNTAVKYKAVTLGKYVENAVAETVTNTGVSLKPFSPAYVRGSRDGSNNLTVTWMRRSRYIGGPLWALPVFEESESYEVDVMSGSTVLRTISSSSETASYSAAEQTADGLTPGDPVTINVYQLSGTVGRGYATEATI